MLSLSTPWALSAVALAVWLLWRARRPRAQRTHTVSNLFLWLDGRARAAAAGAPDRPRPPWHVWVQALALSALAFAAAGPVSSPVMSDAALIIDVSRSMGAHEPGGTRLELARHAARTWLAARPASARVAVFLAGQTTTAAGVFRAEDAQLDGVLSQLTADRGAADFGRALSVARAASAGPIVVVSDAPPPPQTEDAMVEWLPIGSPLDNIGIVTLRSGGPGRALVEAQNFGDRPRDVSLALERAGRTLWQQSVTLDARESRAFLPAVDGAIGTVTARLRTDEPAGDALASDDTLTADVAPRPPVHVLLVTTGNRFLEAALRALPDVTLDLTSLLPAAPTAGTVIVCDNCATAPPRPSLWLPARTNGVVENVGIIPTRADHAVMRGIDFAGVRAVPTVSTNDADVLATAGSRPFISVDELRGGRQLTLAADLSQSEITLSVAFPVLIANAIDWLADRPATGLDQATAAAIAESDLLHPSVAIAGPITGAPAAVVRPWMPAVCLLALVLVAFEWSRRRQRPLARTLAMAMILGAVAGARVPGCAGGRTAVFAIDGSASVSGVRRTALDRVRAEMRGMSSSDRAGLVVFGDRGDRLREPTTASSIDGITLPPASATTNLAAGIRTAQLALPAGGDRRIVLLTDGQPTTGDALGAAATSGAPIDVVALDDRSAPVVRRLDAPADSRTGAAIPLRAEVEGTPGTTIAVDLLRDGTAIGTRSVTMDRTGHGSAAWTDTPARAGVVFYRAAAMDPRLGITVSEAGAGVSIGGRSRVLVVTDHTGDLARRVGSARADVEERAPAALPDTRSALLPYAAVVLDAIAPHRMNVRQLDALSDAVAFDGMGLLVLGDRSSLDASDYAASRFTNTLPIDLTTLPRPPSASMALALLVDTSGSMATTSDGVTKISAAREAVARALAVLPAGDIVQVIGFSSAPTTIVAAADPRDAATVAERLRAMAPGGGTALTPALTQAMTWLRGLSNPVRRVLLVSDGRTTPADGETARAAVNAQGIEVSVVAIGSDADRLWLTNLARSTGGRAYFPDTLRELPRDVAREAARGASGREIDERFRVRAGAHPLAPQSAPELGGYIAGQLRPGAVAAWKSATEDPVLAAWPHGLGRVVLFASDMRGHWGAPLNGWSEGAAFWPRALDWLSRAGDASTADAQLETTAAGSRIIVDTGTSVRNVAAPSVSATVVTPSGATLSVSLHAVTQSRSEAALPLSETGDYRATIVIRDPDTGRDTRFMRGWFWSGDVEAQARGLNMPLLQRIAVRSGGLVKNAGPAPLAGQGVFDGPRARASRDASIGLLLLATFLLFWDYLRALAPAKAHR